MRSKVTSEVSSFWIGACVFSTMSVCKESSQTTCLFGATFFVVWKCEMTLKGCFLVFYSMLSFQLLADYYVKRICQ
jgi:hypothetical protein